MNKLTSSFFDFFKVKKLNKDYIKWEFAVKHSKIGIWDLNTKTNKVFFSPESKQILGYEDHEIKDTANVWNKRVHPDDQEAYYKDFNAHLVGDLDVYKNEHRVRCKNGDYKWIADAGKIISRDKDGKPLRIIGTHIDITKRKENEEALTENNRIITNQNKRLYNFTHIVSHNLKTHIGNLKNVLEFYEETENADEKLEMFEYLKTISTSLTTTITDLNEIISVKNNQEDPKQNININNVVNNVLHNIELDILSKKAVINSQINSNLTIRGNESYLESIFHNLLTNALKYSHPDRTLNAEIYAFKTAEGVEIVVTDNGMGINLEKYKNKIFEMYQTFHESSRKDSKGIGLYLTKIQVEDLGGTISIESKLNVGTTFRLFFPVEKKKLSL